MELCHQAILAASNTDTDNIAAKLKKEGKRKLRYHSNYIFTCSTTTSMAMKY